jgi:hypothetical protein
MAAVRAQSFNDSTERDARLKLYWMRSSEAWPSRSWLEGDRSCFDEDKPDRASDSLRDTRIGNVNKIEAGPGVECGDGA